MQESERLGKLNCETVSRTLTRRQWVAGGTFALLSRRASAQNLARFETPHKYGKLVLSASGEQGEFDRISVDCPFVFRHDSRYYLTYVAFDGIGYQTGLASSSDLIQWKKEGCMLRRDPSSPVTKYNIALNWILRENDLYSAGALKQVDGSFIGVYHSYPNQGYEEGAAVIGICRSKNLRNWILDPPSLLPQDGAAWERGGLYKPCLVEHDGKYYLFYNAKNQTTGRWYEQTGVAVSTDLKLWIRYAQNPIIPNGGPGSPDERFASDPCVLRDGDQWAIYYFGLDGKGVARDLLATGHDFFHVTKSGRIIIDVGPPGSVDAIYAHKPSLIAHQNDLYHFYCAVSKKEGREVRGISVARSRPWTEH